MSMAELLMEAGSELGKVKAELAELRKHLRELLGLDADAVDPEILAAVENLVKFRENVRTMVKQPTGKLGD